MLGKKHVALATSIGLFILVLSFNIGRHTLGLGNLFTPNRILTGKVVGCRENYRGYKFL